MICENEEYLEEFALNTLEPSKREQVLACLAAGNCNCSEKLAEIQESLSLLIDDIPMIAAPAGVKQSIFDRIGKPSVGKLSELTSTTEATSERTPTLFTLPLAGESTPVAAERVSIPVTIASKQTSKSYRSAWSTLAAAMLIGFLAGYAVISLKQSPKSDASLVAVDPPSHSQRFDQPLKIMPITLKSTSTSDNLGATEPNFIVIYDQVASQFHIYGLGVPKPESSCQLNIELKSLDGKQSTLAEIQWLEQDRFACLASISEGFVRRLKADGSFHLRISDQCPSSSGNSPRSEIRFDSDVALK
jgi:hypothetical protein